MRKQERVASLRVSMEGLAIPRPWQRGPVPLSQVSQTLLQPGQLQLAGLAWGQVMARTHTAEVGRGIIRHRLASAAVHLSPNKIAALSRNQIVRTPRCLSIAQLWKPTPSRRPAA